MGGDRGVWQQSFRIPQFYQLNFSKPYIKMSCGLGEAPYYERSRHTLRFVDIVKEKLHFVDLNKGPSSLESFDMGTPVRSAGPLMTSTTACLTLR